MVKNSAVATDIAFKSPIIIEKINQFFGYRAVEKITTLQKPFNAEDKDQQRMSKPDESCYVRAKAMCKDVKDDTVRQSLVDLMALIEKETIDNFNKNIK